MSDKPINATDSTELVTYGIRKCRDSHWHVTIGRLDDLATKPDALTYERALEIASRLNAGEELDDIEAASAPPSLPRPEPVDTSPDAIFFGKPPVGSPRGEAETPTDQSCPCGTAIIKDGITVKSHWMGSICEDCEALIFQRHNAPKCWRCKTRPGVVCDGMAHECIECAGSTMKRTRAMLGEIDEAVRDGLSAWPRIMDRVEFVRECVKLQRERGV